MKILVIGDTHGNNDIIVDLYEKYPHMDAYLHAGDSCSDPYSLYPFQTVRGNCDYFYDINDVFTMRTPYGKLLMKHVPNMTFQQLKKEGVKIYITGHLHARKFYKQEDIYYISPGSTCRERDNYSNGYAILDITSEDVKVEFVDLD